MRIGCYAHRLLFVHPDNGAEDDGVASEFLCHANECIDILWEARPAKACACVQEVLRDPEILPNRRRHLVNIDPELFTDIPDLVCK